MRIVSNGACAISLSENVRTNVAKDCAKLEMIKQNLPS